ncbi:transcriptional activator DEMETER-like [Hibiscus syriacus]|uniref:transcriptional activator DEMETER-like n=1 Tax=Hibiscus syriacus TaxID=106335 RepID=UPI001923C9F7|nr:transcriptional activator DEMETER-like [Hibiscus syriacus]
MNENKIFPANCIDLERCFLGFAQEPQTDGVIACSDSSSSIEVNGIGNTLKASSFGSEFISGVTNGPRRCHLNPTAVGNVSSADLSALANASTSAASEEITGHHTECSSGVLFGVPVKFSDRDKLLIGDICMPRTHQNGIPLMNPYDYDLNLPAAGARGAFSQMSISDFAPVTPEKATRAEMKEVSAMGNLYVEIRTEKNDEQANELDDVRVDGVQCSKELQTPVLESSLTTTTAKEIQNPEHGGGHLAELEGATPQPKQRKRKYMPKVITESKPRKPRTPATPKPGGSEENPTGKRKYVRKNTVKNDTSIFPREANAEKPTGKRKYVRRKGLNKDSTVPTQEESGKGTTHPETLEHNKKSCRRALDFGKEGKERDETSASKPACNINSSSGTENLWKEGSQLGSMIQLCGRIEMAAEKTQTGIDFESNQSVNQTTKDHLSFPEDQAPVTPLPTKNAPSHRRRNTHPQKLNNGKGKGKATSHDGLTALESDAQLPERSPIDTNCRRSLLPEGGQANKLADTQQADATAINSYGSRYNNISAYQMILGMQLPKIQGRKRTEKGQNLATSSASSFITALKNLAPAEVCLADKNELSTHGEVSTKLKAGRNFSLNELQTFNCIMAPNQTEDPKKKRIRGATGIQDLASIIAQCKSPGCCSSQSPVDYGLREIGNTSRPHTSIEPLVTEVQRKLEKTKQSKKRNSLVNSAYSSTSETKMHKKLDAGCFPEEVWKQYFSVDALLEQFNRLDINREGSGIAYQEQNVLVPYTIRYQEHNALVPYTIRYQERNALVVYRDGTIVPFGPTRKRRPRPKVDLDEETNRVWKLLLENINSEGINGTDEEKAKWWEEERRVFSGRADSFIARMHLVQGDRRFSPWKGSVLDSVIGVFLTQNVSDHLSSSAFMSLAAHFPLKSRNKDKLYHEEGTSLVNGAEFYILEPEDSTAIQPVGDQGSMTVDGYQDSEEKEVVNSKELSRSSTATVSSINDPKCKSLSSSGSGLGTYCDSTLNRMNMETIKGKSECSKGEEETNDIVLSSQNSVVSSENSVDFSLVQTAERTGSCSESNSEGGDHTKQPMFDILNSSTSFVQLLQMVGLDRLHEAYSYQNMSTNEISKVKTSQFQNHQGENCDNSGPKSFNREDLMPSANYHPYHILNSEVREIGQTFKEETRLSEASKTKDENMIERQSPLTEESAYQTMDQKDKTVCVQVTQQSSFENNQSSNSIQEDEMTLFHCQKGALHNTINLVESSADAQNKEKLRRVNMSKHSEETLDIIESTTAFDNQRTPQQKMQESNLYAHDSSSNKELNLMVEGLKSEGRKVKKEKKEDFDWDSLRKQAEANGRKREKTERTMDSLDWEAVRCADVNEVAETIKERGMNNVLAQRIKDFLNRLVRDHGSIDLEWLRDVPPDKAKEYLLSIRGLGLKSVECVRLLTLHHLAFPVDTNVGRIAVRLGWVPLQPLPESLQLHLLELYPILESIQKYLWPRLCKLDQRTLYELHYQMITFGKVFCTKGKPNCNACPMRGECRHFASAFASARLALPGPEEKRIVNATKNGTSDQNHAVIIDQLALPLPLPNELSDRNCQSEANQPLQTVSGVNECNPIIEEPASPEPESTQVAENDIEDMFSEDPDEIPTIKLNMEEFTQTLQNYMQNNMELQEGDMSKALVALTAEAASIPTPKLKNVNRLRTEHQVYELPDSHPLLNELDKREPDDPCKYLLAIWTPGETANSTQMPERRCNAQELGKLCDEETCFSCNSIREAESHIVRGTLLIPCRTAMRGSFPLNGTYFQVNEVFADHDSSLRPIAVPREWLWNLPRRMVYFGTSIPSIFKGLTTEGIQHCFWKGYVCVRGFDQKSRAPRPLMARLHFPASKLVKGKRKGAGEDG